MIRLETPLTKEKVAKLRAGQEVTLSGIIYTARDQAHKRLGDLIKRKKHLPLTLKDRVIYYCGPNFKKNKVGACGPTTSSRMDDLLEPLLGVGLCATIGKGRRAPFVRRLFRKYRGVYFLTHAGCGAYLSQYVRNFKLIAFKDLGPEAIFKFEVFGFPLIVGIDARGKDIYERLK